MPTYDYKCPACGYKFEQFRPMAHPEAQCPRCHKTAKRLISAEAGIIFKGSGFYITDHRSPEYKRKAAAEKSGK